MANEISCHGQVGSTLNWYYKLPLHCLQRHGIVCTGFPQNLDDQVPGHFPDISRQNYDLPDTLFSIYGYHCA